MESNKEKILIVDDFSDNINVLNEVLNENYETFLAKDEESALDLVTQNQPDLILMDIMMHDLDGYEVCRRLKQDDKTRDIPVIFISSVDELEAGEDGFEAGAIDYITKPLSASIIKARVHNHLELKHHRDALAQQSMIDGLTGIANRRYFDKRLEEEWDLAERKQWPISVLMCDIDFLKSYNDYYGHLQGDECLKKVASTIQHNLNRSTDFTARFGGEEFACILSDTSPNGALKVSENLIRSVKQLRIPHKESDISQFVTISIGLACCIPNEETSSTQLMLAVDQGLQTAKSQGRNTSFFCKT